MPGPRRNSLAGRRAADSTRPAAALVGRVEGAQRLDLVAEPLDAHRPGLAGREDVQDAAAAGELAATADLGHVLVAELDERARDAIHGQAGAAAQGQRLRPGCRSGAMVCWKSACRLATRMRAGRSARCQAARAATRAADSSRTSSERS